MNRRLSGLVGGSFLLFFLFDVALAQNVDTTGVLLHDTLSIARHDTLGFPPKDTTVVDTLRMRFIPGLGMLGQPVDSTSSLHYKSFRWTDGKTVPDLLRYEQGVFVREFGEAGKMPQIFSDGVDGRNIAVLIDGRPMNDPLTGTFNLFDVPLESIDHLELLSGVKNSASGASTALNLVTRQYNSVRPVTNIRFVQESPENLLTDGLFTQNIARGTNLTFGFTRQVTKGRYKNAALDEWNIRSRVRYNLHERLNLALSYFYTKSDNGINGGVDPFQSTNAFDETGAILYDYGSAETLSRNDWTLSAIGRFLSDTASLTQLSVYSTTLDRQFTQRSANAFTSQLFQEVLFTSVHASSFYGITGRQVFVRDPFSLQFGLTIERRLGNGDGFAAAVDESYSEAFARAELTLFDVITPSMFIRQESMRSTSVQSMGGRLTVAPVHELHFFGEALTGTRFPTMQELYWSDSTLVTTPQLRREQHLTYRAGLDVAIDTTLHFSLSAFYRTIDDAIVNQPWQTPAGFPAVRITNVDRVKLTGMNAEANVQFWNIELRGVATYATYTEADTVKTVFPDWILSGEAAYRNTLLSGALTVRAGVRARFVNSEVGEQFVPVSNLFVENKLTILGRNGVVDLFAVVKIGEAMISLTWDNVSGTQYILSPIYPMPGRHLRLGVNWQFRD